MTCKLLHCYDSHSNRLFDPEITLSSLTLAPPHEKMLWDPKILGPRIVLRPYLESDIEPLSVIANNPKVYYNFLALL